jgi:hypothetical protein
MICRRIVKTPSLPVRAMSASIKAQIIPLHLRHFTQDQITAALRTGKPRVSRCIRGFHKPGSFRKLDGSDDHGNIHTPWTEAEDHQLLHDWLTVGPRWKQLSAKWGTKKRFAIEESMVPRAAASCTRSFIGHEGSREVSLTGRNRLDCPNVGLE